MAGRHARKESLGTTGMRRSKAIWIGISVIVVALLILSGGAYYWLNRPLTHNVKYPSYTIPSNTTTNAISTPAPSPDRSRQTVLLIGTDTRPGETGGNTDVLILASIDPKNKRIELLSIPRDTKIMYPDGSYAKINEGLMLGGPTLTQTLVSQLTGQHIDNYALTHFGGLVQIINTVGGITLNVPEHMYYNTGDKQYNIINLKPGVQTLNGAQALGFVRFRHDALGDIGRTERQQEFLQALADKLLQPQNITKLPTLVNEFWGTIDTDMSMLNVLRLAANADTYRGYQIIHETLPGSFHNPDPKIRNDESYWIVNPLEAKYMATQFFENGLVQKNPVQDPSVTENWTPPAPGSATNTANGTSSDNAGTTNTTTQASGGADTSNVSSSSGVTSTLAPSGPVRNMLVTGSSAYIRSGPDTTYPVIASVVQGQTVTVISESGQWDEVIVGNGQTGYIARWLLGPENP